MLQVRRTGAAHEVRMHAVSVQYSTMPTFTLKGSEGWSGKGEIMTSFGHRKLLVLF